MGFQFPAVYITHFSGQRIPICIHITPICSLLFSVTQNPSSIILSFLTYCHCSVPFRNPLYTACSVHKLLKLHSLNQYLCPIIQYKILLWLLLYNLTELLFSQIEILARLSDRQAVFMPQRHSFLVIHTHFLSVWEGNADPPRLSIAILHKSFC